MKRIIFAGIAALTAFHAAAFEWPQDDVQREAFSSYFGQNRGGTLSTSMVFRNSGKIKAMDDGKILVMMTEQENDTDFFPSALGNSVIIAHADSLISVYGNLERESLVQAAEMQDSVKSGSPLGAGGNSGWQESRSGLEFQIIDTKNSNAVNPKVFMPRTDNEIELTATNVCIENRNGDRFELWTQRNFPAGIYRVYQRRNQTAAPYRTTILVNGVIVDQIMYDTIIQDGHDVCAVGKRKYNEREIYPDQKLQFLGEAMLTQGRTTLGITLEDIRGEANQANYSLSIY